MDPLHKRKEDLKKAVTENILGVYPTDLPTVLKDKFDKGIISGELYVAALE